MKSERTDIKFTLWRKKIDPSAWTEKATTIPNSYVKSWGLDDDFFDVVSKKDESSKVKIKVKKTSDGFKEDNIYYGWLTCAKEGLNKPKGSTAHRKNPAYRLYWPDEFAQILKKTYSMSYIRDIENKIVINQLKNESGKDIRSRDIENDIPFWEFVDIEYDKLNKTFIFVAHYRQKPTFPELFSSLSDNPVLKRMYNDLSDTKDSEMMFYQQSWKPIQNYITEINAINVIYMLYSKQNSSLYIGKADNLINRFKNHHKFDKNNSIYDYYRYDLIPTFLPQKIVNELERMIIRIFQTTFKNNKEIESINIADINIDNSTKDQNR